MTTIHVQTKKFKFHYIQILFQNEMMAPILYSNTLYMHCNNHGRQWQSETVTIGNMTVTETFSGDHGNHHSRYNRWDLL